MNFFNTNIHFLFPEALFLLIILIPLALYAHARRGHHGIQASFLADVQKIYGRSWVQDGIILITTLGVTALGVTALANPVISHMNTEVSKKGIDIMLVMDISKSMLAEDIFPNRIEAAKQTIDTFLQKLDADRVGIILFAGKPFASVPLTFDYDAVRNMLTDISTDSINQTIPGLSGTAIGDAILSATDALDRNTEKEKNRTKTIILLTDGEANVGVNPEIATQYAKEKQVKIYTIGIGKTDGTPLYITDPLSGKKQYFVDEAGKPIIASIDEKSLKSIAETTGGRYFLASDNESLTSIFTTLSKLEKTEIRTKTVTTNESLASYLVYISLFLLVIIGYYHLRVIH